MRLHDPGYTPAVRDVGPLLELVATSEDEEEVKLAERAILRLDRRHAARAARETVERARGATRPGRGRLTRLAGRLAATFDDGEAREVVTEWLATALSDADPKTRRTAARAAAKLPPDERVTRALVVAWDAAGEDTTGDDDRRALAEAMGRIGGDAARERLRGAPAKDKKTVRASLILERTEARRAPGAIDVDAAMPEPTVVHFHTRPGLEGVAVLELGAEWEPRVARAGVVSARLSGPLSRALAARTATHVGFPIAAPSATRADDHAEAIVKALLSDASLAVLRTFSRGAPIRFRLAWKGGGHRRALAWRVAELVREATSELVNDPTKSTWEVVVDDAAAGAVALELVPRGYDDTRFSYRKALVPASSHPTIAAAIARVAPRSASDVVWDPFVGAGAELVERAFLGPYARLLGTDLDPAAASAARANLADAGVANAKIEVADALAFARTLREPVSLILSNPPMGRRVQRGKHLDVLESFVDCAAEVLAPGGALVWTVPDPKPIRSRAERAGLTLDHAWTIDMGGFPAELAVYRKPLHLSRRPR